MKRKNGSKLKKEKDKNERKIENEKERIEM